jgi:protein ImuB
LRWAHDSLRARDAGLGGTLTVRTAEPTRQIEHVCRLLAEHLSQVKLLAPVDELVLQADEVHPLEAGNASLLPDAAPQGEPLHWVLERLAARLGPSRVLRPVLRADHRLEWMCQWQPQAPRRTGARVPLVPLAQPTFILPQPLKLAMRGNKPIYQGELTLLAGPQRVEGGWWDRDEVAADTRNVVRDYWLALSEHAGVLWVFQTRLPAAGQGQSAWYLHGHFA